MPQTMAVDTSEGLGACQPGAGDTPAIGLETVEAGMEARASVLAFEAGAARATLAGTIYLVGIQLLEDEIVDLFRREGIRGGGVVVAVADDQ